MIYMEIFMNIDGTVEFYLDPWGPSLPGSINPQSHSPTVPSSRLRRNVD